jgi:hypothetical protein
MVQILGCPQPRGVPYYVAAFVALRAAEFGRRETLSTVRWPGTPSWAGSPGGREGPINLKRCTGTSAVPCGEEPNDRLEATSPSRKMGIAGAGTKEPRWPGGPRWGGRPRWTPVLRGCGGGVRGEAYSWRSPGVKRNPVRHCHRLRMALGASRRGW